MVCGFRCYRSKIIIGEVVLIIVLGKNGDLFLKVDILELVYRKIKR